MAGNIDKVQMVAQALGELKEQIVFVGGSVVELYADNPEISDIRPTIDVDCVVDLQMTFPKMRLSAERFIEEEHIDKIFEIIKILSATEDSCGTAETPNGMDDAGGGEASRIAVNCII